MATFYRYHHTPIGTLLLAGDGEYLQLLGFLRRHEKAYDSDWEKKDEPFKAVIKQLDEYFDGSRQDFDLPLKPQGTEFQRRVWQALAGIHGETRVMGVGEVCPVTLKLPGSGCCQRHQPDSGNHSLSSGHWQ